jgi:hypothetical protein
MEHYLGVAKEEGISERELGAVQAVVMAASPAEPEKDALKVLHV